MASAREVPTTTTQERGRAARAAPHGLTAGLYHWEIWLWVDATPGDKSWSQYPAWTAAQLRTTGQDFSRMTALVADLATALGPCGWEARLIVDSGHASAFVRKAATPAAEIYADLRRLSASLYRQLTADVLILAEQPHGTQDILELCLTDQGFAPYRTGR